MSVSQHRGDKQAMAQYFDNDKQTKSEWYEQVARDMEEADIRKQQKEQQETDNYWEAYHSYKS